MKVPMPSPNGTNKMNLFVDASFLTPSGGAFDAAPRRMARDYTKPDPAPMFHGESATGADLVRKILDHPDMSKWLTEDERNEVERCIMAERNALLAERAEENGFDASETESERAKMKKERESGGESVEPDPYKEAKDFMRRKGMSEDDIDHVCEMHRRGMPKPGTEGGMGGRTAPVNKMASDSVNTPTSRQTSRALSAKRRGSVAILPSFHLG